MKEKSNIAKDERRKLIARICNFRCARGEDTDEDLDEVLDELRAHIRWGARKLSIWRTFFIGGVDAETLLNRLETSFTIGFWPERMMKEKIFIVQEVKEEIETIVLTFADLGCTSSDEVRDSRYLTEWSQRHRQWLPEGYVVDLLPHEAGPHIREQYKNQPRRECLYIATKKLPAFRSAFFAVTCSSKGHQQLETSSMIFLERKTRIVFRLRKVA